MASLKKKVDFRFVTLENEFQRLKTEAQISGGESPDAIALMDVILSEIKDARTRHLASFEKISRDVKERKRSLATAYRE